MDLFKTIVLCFDCQQRVNTRLRVQAGTGPHPFCYFVLSHEPLIILIGAKQPTRLLKLMPYLNKIHLSCTNSHNLNVIVFCVWVWEIQETWVLVGSYTRLPLSNAYSPNEYKIEDGAPRALEICKLTGQTLSKFITVKPRGLSVVFLWSPTVNINPLLLDIKTAWSL